MEAALNLFVIGGGSGGVACARRAAAHGAKVGIAEGQEWGGTCVNVGCVPKKIMWWASTLKEMCEEGSEHYGFDTASHKMTCDWQHLKKRRDANIARLNGIYEKNLQNAGVQIYKEFASFAEPRRTGQPFKISLSGGEEIYAWNVLIAVGGEPVKLGVPGDEHVCNSDDFFHFEQQPKKIAVFGAGYIAVELSQVLAGLGSETHLFCRTDSVIRKFDPMLGKSVLEAFLRQGGQFHPQSQAERVELCKDGTKTVFLKNGAAFDGFNYVLSCIGRTPMLEPLNLHNLGEQINLSNSKHIVVDEYQNTSVSNIYALGDVCGNVELTPMAIAAGRRLADRLFLRGYQTVKADYELVPSVIFSHPPCATIGLSESQAIEKYGRHDVLVYESACINLFYNVFDIDPAKKPRSRVKMICLKSDDERILGLHIFGMGAEEIIQGFAVAVKMGARKADFDRTVAVHPSFAEEIVTLPPWGLPHEDNDQKRPLQYTCTSEVETTHD